MHLKGVPKSIDNFQSLKLAARYNYLREHGKYLASRHFAGYKAHLYQVDMFFVEVWMRIGLDNICFIEIARDHNVVDNYLKKIDIKRIMQG